MKDSPTPERSLLRVMVLGTAVSFGIVGAIIGSMRDFFHGDATFNFGWRTAAGFVAGAVIGVLFWYLILRRVTSGRKGQGNGRTPPPS